LNGSIVSLTSARAVSTKWDTTKTKGETNSMKRNLFLATIALGMSGALFVATTIRAADENQPPPPPPSFDKGAPGKDTSAISGQSQKFMKASQFTMASIKNSSGETLGQINDLIVDPAMGRIEFAVIAPTGATAPGKLTAVPWPLIRPGTGPGVNLTANIDKEKLSSAQTFDRTQWPDMSQENWAQQVYSHYGLQWQDRTSAGGRVGIGGSEVGTGVSPDRSKNPDNGTAPDGKGTLNPNPPGTLPPDNTVPGKKDSDLK
jgi:sporulation protein YlmC with PRC-barrel domain